MGPMIAGVEAAPPSVHYTILTSGETLILALILAGVLMVAGILATILKLAGILTGTLVLVKTIARILTLVKSLVWGKSKSQTGRQSQAEPRLWDAKTDRAKETLLAEEVEDV